MKVKSESEVTQPCLTLSDPMDCSLPGSSIHGIFQARVLEWVAIAFSDYILEFAQIHILRIHILTCIVLGVSTVAHGEGNGTPLQYSCLENPMDGGAW